jgi:hypothetical protein
MSSLLDESDEWTAVLVQSMATAKTGSQKS